MKHLKGSSSVSVLRRELAGSVKIVKLNSSEAAKLRYSLTAHNTTKVLDMPSIECDPVALSRRNVNVIADKGKMLNKVGALASMQDTKLGSLIPNAPKKILNYRPAVIQNETTPLDMPFLEEDTVAQTSNGIPVKKEFFELLEQLESEERSTTAMKTSVTLKKNKENNDVDNKKQICTASRSLLKKSNRPFKIKKNIVLIKVPQPSPTTKRHNPDKCREYLSEFLVFKR